MNIHPVKPNAGGCPVLADLSAHHDRIDREEALANEISRLEDQYIEAGDLEDAAGRVQDGRLNQVYHYLLVGDLNAAKLTAVSILHDAAQLYAKEQIEQIQRERQQGRLW